MYVRLFTFTILVIVSFNDCQSTRAADTYRFPDPYFLPGDAFFHTVITEEVLKKLNENPDYAFEYGRPYWMHTIPGYYTLSLGKQNRKLAKQIHDAYEEVRYSMSLLELRVRGKSPNSISSKPSQEKTDFVEINGPHLFFYNEGYDWQKRHVALKYNENWSLELQKFGYQKASYGAFVNKPEAIIESWRFSKVVAPLSVQLHEQPIIKHRAIRKPMIAKGRLKAIMLPDNHYRQYYDVKDDLSLIEITNDGYFTFFAGEGEWHKIGE